MDFSSLVKAVQDFWSFIWPPVLCVMALMGTARFIAPNYCRRVAGLLLRTKPSAETQISFAKISKRFGFDKLAPVITAFTLLFVLSATKNIVIVVGSLVPIEVSFNPDRLLQQHASSPAVSDLWFAYGAKDGLSAFREQIQRTVDEARQKNANAEVVSGLDYWRRTEGGYSEMFSACKFLLLWSIAMLLLELRERQQRARAVVHGLILSVVLLFSGAVYVVLYLYAVNQENYAALSVATAFKTPESHGCFNMSNEKDEKCEAFEHMMEPAVYGRQHRWWNIEFAPSSVLRWLFQGITHGT